MRYYILSFVMGAALLAFTCCSSHSKAPLSPRDDLKIGTIHQIKAENVLYDYTLGIFTLLSNPPLLRMNQQGEIEGFLAERYTVSPDFTTWTFYIKKHFFWSDGVPVTPRDVKFSLEYKGRHVPSRRWIEKTLSRAVIGPDNTVVLTFKKPYTRLDTEFTSLRIFPGHIWEEVEEPQYHPPAGQYVGYGPFIIRETDANAGVVLFNRNPFWKGKKPGISRIEIQIYQNLDVLGLALEKGDIDTFYQYANSYPYANLSRLAASGDFNLVENRSSGLILLGFNLQREPVSHSWFRLAVSYAIDYKEILKLIASGYGEVPRRGFVPVNMPYFQETPRLEQDFHKAREILRQHGCKSADREALLLLSTPPHLRLCELIKDYLAGAGIAVEVKVVDSATWFSMKERYDYDLIITNTTPWGMRMHANWGTGYFDSRRSGEGVLHTLPDPVFLKLCDDILSTRDTVRLQGYARQLQDYYREQIPALALLWKTNVTPFNKSFAGWHADPLFGTFNVANFLDLRRVDAGP